MRATYDGLGYSSGVGGTVTQITSITTGVSLNQMCGTITTVSQTIAAGATATFTVTNTYVDATDAVVVNLKSTSSAGGPWNCYCSAVTSGGFDVTIRNDSAANAGDNTLDITFFVLKGVAS